MPQLETRRKVVLERRVWEGDEDVQCSSLSTWVSRPAWCVRLLVYWLYVC